MKLCDHETHCLEPQSIANFNLPQFCGSRCAELPPSMVATNHCSRSKMPIQHHDLSVRRRHITLSQPVPYLLASTASARSISTDLPTSRRQMLTLVRPTRSITEAGSTPWNSRLSWQHWYCLRSLRLHVAAPVAPHLDFGSQQLCLDRPFSVDRVLSVTFYTNSLFISRPASCIV